LRLIWQVFERNPSIWGEGAGSIRMLLKAQIESIASFFPSLKLPQFPAASLVH